MLTSLLAALVCTAIPPAHAGPNAPKPRVVDPARAKAQEASRQRLVAKLRDEAPKVHDPVAKTNPLELPIFHRRDRP